MTELQNLTIIALAEEGWKPSNWMAVLSAAPVMEKDGLYCIFYIDGSIAMYVKKQDMVFKIHKN